MRSPQGCHWTWGNENSRINMERAAPGLTATSSGTGSSSSHSTWPSLLPTFNCISPFQFACAPYNSLLVLQLLMRKISNLLVFQGSNWIGGRRGGGETRPEGVKCGTWTGGPWKLRARRGQSWLAACEKTTLDIPRAWRRRRGHQNSQDLEDSSELELDPLKASFLLGTSR